MQLQFAAKKIDGAYEAALIVDNKFARAAGSRSASDLLTKLTGAILAAEQQDGSEISVTVVIMTAAEVQRNEAREARQRQTQESEAESDMIEKLTAAVNREKAARTAAAEAAR